MVEHISQPQCHHQQAAGALTITLNYNPNFPNCKASTEYKISKQQHSTETASWNSQLCAAIFDFSMRYSSSNIYYMLPSLICFPDETAVAACPISAISPTAPEEYLIQVFLQARRPSSDQISCVKALKKWHLVYSCGNFHPALLPAL